MSNAARVAPRRCATSIRLPVVRAGAGAAKIACTSGPDPFHTLSCAAAAAAAAAFRTARVVARAAAAAARAATIRAAAAAARATADDATVSLSLSFAFPCLSRAQPLGSALHRASRPQRRRMRLCARAIADSRVQCAAAMSVTSDVLAASYFLPTSHIPASVSVSQRTKRCSRVISQQYSNGFGARLID